jgi:uncharacterized cupredoxin-like copper-binding protein
MKRFVSAGARRSSCVIAVGVLAAMLATACGGHGAAATGNTPIVNVTERDFQIAAPATVQAGMVVLRVQNKGPVGHELIVVRAPNAHLPMRSGGLTVDEERLQRVEAGALEPIDAPATRDLELRLTPGRYVLFCNMSGHFIGGMHHVLVVR